jgi:HD-like signal output (HDOD) protein
VGAYLAGLWGLPRGIVGAVACHHGPFQDFSETLNVAEVVHVADVLDHERRALAADHNLELDASLLADAAFASRLERWRAMREATDFGGGH